MDVERIEIDLNPRERRLYDRLRAQVVAPGAGEPSGIRDLLLLLPDVVVLFLRLMRDPRVPVGAKAVSLLGVGYVLSPIDLLPEIVFGPFGFIDDLLVVAAALSRILNQVHPDVVRSHWPGRGDALRALHRITGWSEEQIGGRVRGLLRGLQRRFGG